MFLKVSFMAIKEGGIETIFLIYIFKYTNSILGVLIVVFFYIVGRDCSINLF